MATTTTTSVIAVADDQFHVKAAVPAAASLQYQHAADNDAADIAATATTTTTSPFVGFVSGCAGAIALVYVGQPLDTIKVRMQLSSSAVVAESAGRSGGVSMWSCVRDMWHQAAITPLGPGEQLKHNLVGGGDAIKGVTHTINSCSLKQPATKPTTAIKAARMTRLMYAGTAAALLANVAENGVLFAAYGPCQRLVSFACGLFNTSSDLSSNETIPIDNHVKAGELGPLGLATAGSLAAFCSAFALCPTELIKVRLQAADLEAAGTAGKSTTSTAATSTWQVVRQVWTTEGGVRGMYRGFGSTVAREMPGYYVFFLAYEASRRYLGDLISPDSGATAIKPGGGGGGGHGGGHDEDPAWVTMVAGAAAGSCLWLVVYPVDAVKSRIQAQSGSGADPSSSGFLRNVVDVVRRDGPLALYRGLAPTLIRTVPASAVMFWTVERTKTLLNGYGL